MKRPGMPGIALLVILLAAGGRAEGAERDPRISDLDLKQGEDHVLLSAHLEARFDDEVRQAVRGGVPLKFIYRIRLTRKGSLFGERIVRDRALTHVLEYDPVRRLYLFTGEGYGSRQVGRTTRDEEEAIEWLTHIRGYRLYPLNRLDRDTRYRVRVMATLRSVELPSVLGYLFFFTTIFNLETPWAQVDFVY